jgi:hypothetical protein
MHAALAMACSHTIPPRYHTHAHPHIHTDAVQYMPVHADSFLFKAATAWQFPAFVVCLGSSYMQRMLLRVPQLLEAALACPGFKHYCSYLPSLVSCVVSGVRACVGSQQHLLVRAVVFSPAHGAHTGCPSLSLRHVKVAHALTHTLPLSARLHAHPPTCTHAHAARRASGQADEP